MNYNARYQKKPPLIKPALAFVLPIFLAIHLLFSSNANALGESKPAGELLPTQTFSPSSICFLRSAEKSSIVLCGADPSVELKGVSGGPNIWSHVGFNIRNPPTDTKLSFSCSIRGANSQQKVLINTFAYDDRELLQYWSEPFYLDKNSWKAFQTNYVFPSNTRRVAAWVVNASGMPCYLAKPSLKANSDIASSTRLPLMEESTLLHAHAETAVQARNNGDVGTIIFPIPGCYREQIPLTLDVSTDSPETIVKYQIKRREDSSNWICEVAVRPTEKGCKIAWDSLVLITKGAKPKLPRSEPQSAPESSAWLKSTACVQSEDPSIKLESARVGNSSDDVETYARKVIAFTSKNHGNPLILATTGQAWIDSGKIEIVGIDVPTTDSN